jgi:hypothetical protein
MARLYSNENFPLPVVEELRRLGHDDSDQSPSMKHWCIATITPIFNAREHWQHGLNLTLGSLCSTIASRY